MATHNQIFIGRRRLKANVLHDSIGFIIDPEHIGYKCGWGQSTKEAIDHCLERNEIA